MPNQSDVIVVGAGPAGSMAAAVLARAGLRVLLLDREHFPRDKACGDVVPLGCFLELEKIGMSAAALERFHIRRLVLEGSHQVRRAFSLHEETRGAGRLGTSVVSRLHFDSTLRDHAVACGAEFRALKVTAPVYDEAGRVAGVVAATETGDQVYGSALVIAADGATSVLARRLGYPRPPNSEWAVALRGYVETETDLDEAIELAFLDEIQPGYAWFFPIAPRRANVGVGMRTDYYRRGGKELSELLADYLARPAIADRIGSNRVEEPQSWPVPFFSFARQRVFDGALLAGDAGGFVHPLTAAGIYAALMTGRFAAETAIHALAVGDVSRSTLAGYDQLWHDALAADFGPAVTASKLATLFPHIVSSALLLADSATDSATDSPSAAEPELPFSLGKF